MKILILFTVALAMLNTTGCATAITSYQVSYGEDACPLKVTADTAMGASVRINDIGTPCDPPKENGE